ncbi:MAG: hypothetical protein NZ874_10025 [Fimbriimonadales bacterium]|nr:hypothetical protein [Fimbriimonadales bacterium]
MRSADILPVQVARTVLSVPCLDTTVQATPVGGDADATAWAQLPKPLWAWARRPSHRRIFLCQAGRFA